MTSRSLSQPAIFKNADIQEFSYNKFFHSLTIQKEQFKNLRLVKTTPTSNTNAAEDFWIDAQEVTNEEYQKFVIYCRDSSARNLLYYVYGTADGKEMIDWKKPLTWKGGLMAESISSMLITYDSVRNYQNLQVYVDRNKLVYGEWPDSNNIIPVYPDTLCWMRDSGNEEFAKNYFSGQAFKNHPVVGISYWQATAYCRWLQQMWNSALIRAGNTINYFEVRLPTAFEWEAALIYSSKTINTVNSPATHPLAVTIKDKKAIYSLVRNVAEWVYDSTGSMQDLKNIKAVIGCSLYAKPNDLQQNLLKGVPANMQHSTVGFRYVVRLKIRDIQ